MCNFIVESFFFVPTVSATKRKIDDVITKRKISFFFYSKLPTCNTSYYCQI